MTILSIVQRLPFFRGRNVWTMHRQGANSRVLNCPLFRVSIIAGSTVYVCSLALCQRVCTRTDNMV